MIDRFEKLTSGISRIYKSIQKIKKHEMQALGLKGPHVMPMYFLMIHPEGLTPADLCVLCNEDKAGISRILSDLEQNELISYELSDETSGDKKRYRSKAFLTENGWFHANTVKDLILNATALGGRQLNDEDRETFYRVLALIADNLEEVCQKLS